MTRLRALIEAVRAAKPLDKLVYLVAVCVAVPALAYLAGTPADHEIAARSAEANELLVTTSSVNDSASNVGAATGGPVATVAPTTSTTSTTSTTVELVAPTSTTVAATTTVPSTAAVEPLAGGSCSGWGELLSKHFPGEESTACRVFIGCESGGNPSAVSATNDHGLAQVNATTWNRPGHHDPVADWIGRHWHNVYDADTNLAMAKKIRDAYGWNQWSCF